MTPVTWSASGDAPGKNRGLRVARTRVELERELAQLRSGGATVAFVPTMGFLHPGHLALLDRARELADRVVLSVFVNPLQFGPEEDLDRYPRSLGRDLELASARGAVLAFAPSVEEMYPGGPPRVRVHPGPGGELLCGAFRPGHFEGVLTAVARLFGLVRPDVAVFGRKDAQQVALVRQMVRDLELRVEIAVAPLVREMDGLAMSSRNAYLTPAERGSAPALFQALSAADMAFRGGEHRGAELEALVRRRLEASPEEGPDAPRLRLDYVQAVDSGTLDPVQAARPGHLLAAAGWIGETRLIDNVVLGADAPDPRVSMSGRET
ncbi:MAG: pantoate--beta-alanine ligase [Gemmatimonadales bacterium]|nr:MAG: pantoate--beta-alanine ligase [Gemmatimonadales bacterium]